MADTPAPPHLTTTVDPSPPARVAVLLAVTLAYVLAGWVSLQIAVPPGDASPLFPSAGIALAAVLVYGPRALWAVALGSIGVQPWPFVVGDGTLLRSTPTMLAIAAGATAQAALGAWLTRRSQRGPVTLDTPQQIARTFGLAGALACMVSASVGSLAMWASGRLHADHLLANWATWWCGDLLGVVIGTPVTLCLIGRPRDAWRPRRTTVALPLAAATLMMGLAIAQIGRWDDQRREARFERDAVGLVRGIEARLQAHLDALDAMQGLYIGSLDVEAGEFREVSRNWLAKLPSLQAIGWHERVARDRVAAFEAAVRAADQPSFHVFQRDAALTAADDDLIVMRYVEPLAGNDRALGVNALSVRAAREAIAQARRVDTPVATAGFRLTQDSEPQVGVVVYRAVRGPGDAPPALRGLVFVTLRMSDALASLAREAPGYLRICLLDTAAAPDARLLAGPDECRTSSAGSPPPRHYERELPFGGRRWAVRVLAPGGVPAERGGPLGSDDATAWLFAIAGLAAAGLLGALLLLVTGRTRLTESAVAQRTRELQQQIGEREQAEAALRASEERFRGIFNSAPIGVVYTDLDSRIEEPNATYCQMLGYRADELVGRAVISLTHREDRSGDSQARDELIAGRLPFYRRRKRYLTKDGGVLWVQVTVSLLRDELGRPHRLVGVIEDISEHLRLEEAEHARESAESANRAKSEFLSRMSHELRTPLNAMLGFAQLLDLDRHTTLHERHRLWVAQIREAGWHLLEMINDVLDLSRIESGTLALQLQPLAVEPLIAASMALVEPQARQHGVTLVRALADHGALPVRGDPTRVKQILTNLLSNAVKYNRPGGEVQVSTRRAPVGDGREQLEIDVVDTGLGLDAEQLAQMFQPFNRLGRERGPTEGTGIGLVIAKLLAERMGGTLQVSSEPGVGSTFTLLLPLDDEPPTPHPHDDGLAPTEADYHRRRVLYIEDNETNVEVMRGMLGLRPQVEMIAALTGLDGLAAVRTAQPDLVLLDMNLPDIDGMALLQHLQADETTATLPVVIVSADALPRQIEAALKAGATRYLTKPVAVDELLAVVDELLAQQITRFG